MEMQTKDNRIYTNQLPKWAIVFHIGFISLFLVIGIGFLAIAIKGAITNEFGFFLIFFAFSAIFLGFSRFCYKNLQNYTKYLMQIELGEDGYKYYFHNKKNKDKTYVFIPYENMEYVLIGMDYQVMPRQRVGHDVPTLQSLRTAKIIIYGVSSNGHPVVLSFTHGNQIYLIEWIHVFQEHNVTIFQTDKALTATPNTPEGIQEVPKQLYEGNLLFEVGSLSKDMDNIFLNKKQQDVIEKNVKKRRKKGLLYTMILSLLQIIMICFWFPEWDIEGGSFDDDSGLILAFLFTIFTQIFIYLYMRRVKWYDPIKDMIIITVGIVIGSLLSPAARPTFHSAVEHYGAMVVGWFLFSIYVFKLFGWLSKIEKNRKKNTHKERASF
ncbi:hypothetical protein ACQKP0_20405 [Heyndrickxia sp. NPDC080065]|uniref:hypothetical protein n=1 Tax=Heyndrickxia sp. NPDC080065 TaxID=3390568 RepID=UPI003D059CDC